MKNGNNNMVAGNICVVSNATIPKWRPLNSNRERAYALVDANTTPVNVTTNDTNNEFKAHFKKSPKLLSLEIWLILVKVSETRVIEKNNTATAKHCRRSFKILFN